MVLFTVILTNLICITIVIFFNDIGKYLHYFHYKKITLNQGESDGGISDDGDNTSIEQQIPLPETSQNYAQKTER
jgi:hypothetical protein